MKDGGHGSNPGRDQKELALLEGDDAHVIAFRGTRYGLCLEKAEQAPGNARNPSACRREPLSNMKGRLFLSPGWLENLFLWTSPAADAEPQTYGSENVYDQA